MKDRTVRILDLLSNNKRIKVTMLAELLDVSQVTLRKDLDNLEKLGIIHRTHGYASLDGADDTSKRMAFCYSIKRMIAKTAAQIVEDGETILLDSGSCCALFAEELALSHKNITIITNSVFIANYVGKMQSVKIILLGGYFQTESQVLVGQMAVNSAENFYTDKFFMGTDGFIPDQGFTGMDYLRVETAQGLARCAKKIYVLTEAAKFFRRGAYNLIQLDKVTSVITDVNIPKEAEAAIQKNHITLHKVPAVEERLKWRKFPEQPPILLKERV